MSFNRPRASGATRPRVRWALPFLLALFGCSGPDRDQFPPVCPQAEALPGAGDLALYRPGGGRDLTDVQIEGRVLSAAGSCKDGDKAGTVEATLALRMRFQRGPAAPTRQANILYFVAVARDETILNKRLFVQQVTFPQNVDAVVVTTKPSSVILPVGADRSAGGYQLWVGFQH